jgi:hypothetical protein
LKAAVAAAAAAAVGAAAAVAAVDPCPRCRRRLAAAPRWGVEMRPDLPVDGGHYFHSEGSAGSVADLCNNAVCWYNLED